MAEKGQESLTHGVIAILGGRKALKKRARSSADLQALILDGFSYSALESVMDKLDLGRSEACETLDLSPRTFSRRKGEKKLRSDESDRLYRVARIAALATEVFGTTEKASRWLHRANRALGGKPPLGLLRTDLGTRQVEQVLGRIEHGVVG